MLKSYFDSFVLLFVTFYMINRADALKCFTCDGCSKIDMNARQYVQVCDAGQNYCKKEETEDGLGWTRIFKECVSACTESDSYNNRVKCCSTDACNSSNTTYNKEIFNILLLGTIYTIFKILNN